MIPVNNNNIFETGLSYTKVGTLITLWNRPRVYTSQPSYTHRVVGKHNRVDRIIKKQFTSAPMSNSDIRAVAWDQHVASMIPQYSHKTSLHPLQNSTFLM